MSKGDKRRPTQIPRDELDRKWEQTFGDKKPFRNKPLAINRNLPYLGLCHGPPQKCVCTQGVAN